MWISRTSRGRRDLPESLSDVAGTAGGTFAAGAAVVAASPLVIPAAVVAVVLVAVLAWVEAVPEFAVVSAGGVRGCDICGRGDAIVGPFLLSVRQ